MNRIYGAAIPDLETQMRFRMVRQGALASNVANADTPNYRRLDVTFEEALHQANQADPSAAHRVIRGPRGTRPDGNGVDRDQEVIGMVRNAGAFQDMATVLARIYAMRRMAATGQLS